MIKKNFIEPQIQQLMKHDGFQKQFNEKKSVWMVFKVVKAEYLKRKRAEYYQLLVSYWTAILTILLTVYEAMSCNMSFDTHLFDSHQKFFLENRGDVSGKNGDQLQHRFDFNSMEILHTKENYLTQDFILVVMLNNCPNYDFLISAFYGLFKNIITENN